MTMSRRTRFFWGGLGAIFPILISLTTLDPKTTFVALSLPIFLVYTIRCAVLFCMGGLSVFTDDQEGRPIKLIQAGIAAPALFAGFIAGTNISGNPDENKSAALNFQPPARVQMLSMVASAQASEPERKAGPEFLLRSFEDELSKKQTVTNILKQGLLARNPEDTYFILIKETGSAQEAKDFAGAMYSDLSGKDLLKPGKDGPNISVSVFQPYKDKLKYTVVLGENLTHEQADIALKLLLEKDFAGAEIWDLACECYPEREQKKGAD